jgi:hypothetical protein
MQFLNLTPIQLLEQRIRVLATLLEFCRFYEPENVPKCEKELQRLRRLFLKNLPTDLRTRL